SRESGDDQHAFEIRVPVDDEIIVGRVVVEANSSFSNSRIRQSRYRFAKERPAIVNKTIGHSFFVRVRIGDRALMMISDLHRAIVVNWKPVEPALQFDKDRKLVWLEASCTVSRWLKVRDVLMGCSQTLIELRQKETRPGSRGGDCLGANEIVSLFCSKLYRSSTRSQLNNAAVFEDSHASINCNVKRGAQRLLGEQHSAARVKNTKRGPARIELGKPRGGLLRIKELSFESAGFQRVIGVRLKGAFSRRE